MKDIKTQVENILKSYPKMKKELLLMEFELNYDAQSLSSDFIEGTVLARPGHEMTFGSHISDKTADIVVNHIDGQRGGKYYALIALVHSIRFELRRLEYYLSLLPEEQASVIRWFYFDGFSSIEISELTGCSQSTMQRRKRSGLDKLASCYSVLDNFNLDGIDIRSRVRFIGYIHEERFAQCLKMVGGNGNAEIKAMLYIISGCNDLWNVGVETFLNFSTGESISYDENIDSLSDNSANLLRFAYSLAYELDRENLISVLSRHFPELEHVHLELAIEAVKLVLFSYDC